MDKTSVACKRLLNSLLLVVILLSGEMQAQVQTQKPWMIEHELQHGCLLLDPMPFDAEVATAAVKPIANQQDGTRELLENIARQITHGIVSGNHAVGSVINNHHSSVDLTVFIANYVDNHWMSQDEYW